MPAHTGTQMWRCTLSLERVATGLDLEDGLEELGLKARA